MMILLVAEPAVVVDAADPDVEALIEIAAVQTVGTLNEVLANARKGEAIVETMAVLLAIEHLKDHEATNRHSGRHALSDQRAIVHNEHLEMHLLLADLAERAN